MWVSAVTQERKPYIKKKKKFNRAASVFCRVTNVNFRKVSRDNIRPEFQLGRKEPYSKSLSCIESVKTKTGAKRNKSGFKFKHDQFTY